MATYRIDSLHPDRLTCETCGDTVAALPPDGRTELDSLTVDQAMRAWPELAAEIVEHDTLCAWRRMPAGAKVYVHLLPKEEPGS
jgi:hypothetical protein